MHLNRPDGDNLEKFLNDALNTVLWGDDSQIVYTIRSKTIIDSKVGETLLIVHELPHKYVSNYENFFIEDLFLQGEKNV